MEGVIWLLGFILIGLGVFMLIGLAVFLILTRKHEDDTSNNCTQSYSEDYNYHNYDSGYSYNSEFSRDDSSCRLFDDQYDNLYEKDKRSSIASSYGDYDNGLSYFDED